MNHENEPTSCISKSHTQNQNSQYLQGRWRVKIFHPVLKLDSIKMKYNRNTKILGINLDEKLLWNEHNIGKKNHSNFLDSLN